MMMMMMMIVTMMQWVLLLTVFVGRLRTTSPGNATTTPTQYVPSSEYYVELQTEVVTSYTELDDLTPHSGDAKSGSAVFQDGATTEISTTVLANFDNIDNSTEISKDNFDQTEISTKQTIQSSTEPSTVMYNVSTSNIDLRSTNTSEQDMLSTFNSPQYNSSLALSEKPTTKTTLKGLTSPLNLEHIYNNLSTTVTSQHESSKNYTPKTGTSAVSEITTTSGGTGNFHTKMTASVSAVVPKDELPRTLISVEAAESSTSSSTPSSSTELVTTFQRIISEATKKDYVFETTTKLPAQVSKLITTGTKVRQTISSTHGTTEVVTIKDDDEEQDNEVDEDDENTDDYDHKETDYERSLRTRRVINHAALWITIGFVVVLVSYITVLLIYNRTRPDWQDPQRPYSRFENEPEFNENNMEYDNEEFLQDSPQHENRRDFSQCVDPRDFPACDESGSREFLLYEDPTCIDQAAYTDFTYRDEC